MRGGWMGSTRTAGGLARTYGLQRHFSKDNGPGPENGISRAGLKRIFRYFRPYLKRWIVIFICISVSAGLGVLPPFCVGSILDYAIPEQDSMLLALLAGAMVGLAILTGLIGVLQQSLTARAGQSMMFDLRNELFQHLQRMSLHFYTSTRSGEIVSRLSNDVSAVQNVANNTLVTIIRNTMTLTATSIALISMNWRLALLAVVVVPAFYLPSAIVGKVRRRLSATTQARQASLTAFMQERLHTGGLILTRIFGQAPADSLEFADRSGEVRDLHIRQAVIGRWLFMVLSVFSTVGPALIYWYGGLQVIQADLKIGQLVAFAALLSLLYRPLVQLATVYVDIQASVAVFERIFEYLDLVPDVRDRPDAAAPDRIHGHIVFDRVSFSYPRKPALPSAEMSEDLSAAPPNGEEPFRLQDISFEIKAGTQVALVGPSGAGKTTITYLMPRFYDPNQGRICIDGHDLRDIRQDILCRHIGMVTQETSLFHSSIRENLLYACPDASEDQIIDACRAANIHDFIACLPQGYNTVVGERGFRLSGGEKQRVSIARALLKDPAVLILDEATSSLDATSEYLIQDALEKLLENRTSLIIAHRLSTILNSNQIVVMDKGTVIETGTHEDLLDKSGLYSKLFYQQFGKVLDAN